MNTRVRHPLLFVSVLGLACASGNAVAQTMDHAAVAQPSATVGSDPIVSNGASMAVDRQSEQTTGEVSVTGRRMSRRMAVSPTERAGFESQLSGPFTVARPHPPRPLIVIGGANGAGAEPRTNPMLVNLGGPLPSLPAYSSKPKPDTRRRTMQDQLPSRHAEHLSRTPAMRSSHPDGASGAGHPDTSPR
jgi:hypothetical protein